MRLYSEWSWGGSHGSLWHRGSCCISQSSKLRWYLWMRNERRETYWLAFVHGIPLGGILVGRPKTYFQCRYRYKAGKKYFLLNNDFNIQDGTPRKQGIQHIPAWPRILQIGCAKRRAIRAKGLVKFGFFRESRSNGIDVCMGGVLVEMELVTSANKWRKFADGHLLRWVQSLPQGLITGVVNSDQSAERCSTP